MQEESRTPHVSLSYKNIRIGIILREYITVESVNIKISTKDIKSIQKVGLDKFAKANGVDLKKF